MTKITNNYLPIKKTMTLVEYYAECDRKRNEISYDCFINKTKQNVTKIPAIEGKNNKRFINTTLILKNLPHNCTSSHELLKIFKNCGSIKFIKILKDKDCNCKGLAFIRFETREGSDMGLDMDGFWYGEQKIFVEYANDHRE